MHTVYRENGGSQREDLKSNQPNVRAILGSVRTKPPMHGLSFSSSLIVLIIRAQSRKITEMRARKAKTDMTETCMVLDASQVVQYAILYILSWETLTVE